jgi:hypothetical protein
VKRALLFALALAACGGRAGPAAETPPPSPSPEAALAAPEVQPVTGVVACDEWIAYAYAFAMCPQAAGAYREDTLSTLKQVLSSDLRATVGTPQEADLVDLCTKSTALVRDGADQLGCALAIPDEDYVTAIRSYQAPRMVHCDEYVVVVQEEYARCDRILADQRQRALDGVDKMRDSWGDVSAMPSEARAQTDDACAQAIEALRKGMREAGCAF